MWSTLVLNPPKIMVFCTSNYHTSSILSRNATLNHPFHPKLVSASHKINKQQHTMDKGFTDSFSTEYEEALNCLSSLITKKTRGDGSNRGDKFDIMFDYLKILELEDPISKLSIIHVAGTKGKGSTCAFTESILRNCGFRTGLFTSPHLIDIRERFRINGVEIAKEKFLLYFWWCWNKLQENSKDLPMPTYFRFLALLGFKIFSAEKVDVAILEVGLGGKYDATNVVKEPVVCGITSLGYDHMEILGYTLGEIAGEKAGIFKQGVPAYTVPQKEEAMSVLKEKASQLGIPLQVASPLNKESLSGQQLGLSGEHQYLNAALAVSLSSTWLQKVGHDSIVYENKTSLGDQFIKGLTTVNFEGRAQVVYDPITQDSLVFYLDGAHSPESLDACARWFSHAIKDEIQSHNSRQILLFNCMSVRDPQLLLPPLVNGCACHSIHFDKALFVPNQSVYNKVGSHATPQNEIPQVDLSWQLALQRVYENLAHGDKGKRSEEPKITKNGESSSVFSSLPQAIKWLRENAMQNRSLRFQVLVTGSLHLVGDVLKLIKK